MSSSELTVIMATKPGANIFNTPCFPVLSHIFSYFLLLLSCSVIVFFRNDIKKLSFITVLLMFLIIKHWERPLITSYFFNPVAPAEGQYLRGNLERENLGDDPFNQFHEWFNKAASTEGLTMPEATTLSTAHLPSGRVSARIVYLKELDSRGFVVYSNWGTSRKSEDIRSNGHASLTFWWKELERQVRVEGITERLTPEQSQVYYDTRYTASFLL